MARAKKKKRAKKLKVVDAEAVGGTYQSIRPTFDPRVLAKSISEVINKGKAAKNKRERPIRTGADADNADIIRYVSSGTSAIDAATGGGFPCGRMSMVYGAPSAGKSLLLESAIFAAQMRGGIGCIIDSEHTFNKARFSAKGGHVPSVLFLDAKSLEQGFEYIEGTIKGLMAEPSLMGKPIVIGWDTINTNQTANKVKGNEYAAGMMEAPRVIWDGFRRATELIAESNVALIVLNQVYGDKIAPGGRGLKFYSSQILYLEEEDTYRSYRTGRGGKLLKAEIMKNKANPPLEDVVFFCCDSVGIDDPMSIYYNLKARGKGARLVDPGVFKKAGGWSSYILPDGEKVAWQGDKGFYNKTVEVDTLVDSLAGELWGLWPPADPPVIEADDEFVQFYEKDNDWVTVGKRYSHCIISDHQCPVKVWQECRAGYWTDCMFELEDVVTLERVYHNPPPLEDEETAKKPEKVEDEDDTDDES